ncbi:MAG: DNA primase [Nitrospirae bacterium]|nr:DNA primase [Nitrospirota bacterium]
MKSDGILEEIKGRLDIVELISEYVSIKKVGQNYKGLCPFHPEKTPSFMVSPHKQIFHCFGCGSGGDILSFIIKYENLSFNEALRILAKKAGVKLKDYSLKKDEGKETLKEIHEEASKLFVKNLEGSRLASEYLKSRGLKDDTISRFSLGYAHPGWHQLYEHLKGRGFPESLMLQSGLLSTGPKGVYDNFRARIMFPISSPHGDVIAFGGRVMDNGMPKYLNSPDTVLFKKGETLYCLNMAEKEIRGKDCAIAVEGYFDAIMCHQNGIGNVVAPLGTALTTGHLKRLKRFTNNIIVIFDGDTAGLMAAKRSVSLMLEHGMRPKALILPEGKDPDSLLREKGHEYMTHLIEKASTMPLDFFIKTSSKPKAETVKEVLALISKVNDPIYKEELLLELTEKSKMSESTLRKELKNLVKAELHHKGVAMSMTCNEELLLLSAIVSFPEKKQMILKDISLEDIKDTLLRKAFQKVISLKDIASGVQEEDSEENRLIRILSVEPGFDITNVDKNIDDCIKKIKKRQIDERIQIARESEDLGLLSSLLTERKKLTGETTR